MKGLIAAMLVALAIPAQASNCGSRDLFVVLLEEKGAEAPKFSGISGDDVVFEFFTSDDGSWTLIFTTRDGVSCLGTFGQSFEAIEPAALRLPPNL